MTQGAGLWNGRLLEFEVLPSTNTWALGHLPELQHGDVVQAHHQAAGRGRFDRGWISPAGTCLTLSVVLDSPAPDDPVTVATTRMAACAARATLEDAAVAAMLKWPNDVLVRDRKIAGILAERDAEAGKLVLGIGLNVNLPSEALSGLELLQPATSMTIELGSEADIGLVRKSLLRNLQAMLALDLKRLRQEWTSHDALTGRSISISTATARHSGNYAGMDDNGRLLLEITGSGLLSFDSGDVTIDLTPARPA